mmetsp:Transcript_9116/g.31433  ORF Transcript_9116/g.31433 Transcript_9116/m.31433 type:complete len:208 (+) Transcript_9116:2403-3026(+)
MMSCSRKKKVRLWSTFCLTWTLATHWFGFAACLVHTSHIWFVTTYSTTKVCCKMAPLKMSFCIVSLTLSLLEWGSVQINDASTSLILFRPLVLLMQNVSSSLDSSAAVTQCFGGCKYLPHPSQYSTVTCLWMPSVMSTWVFRQFTHMFAGLGWMLIPHRQHNTCPMVCWGHCRGAGPGPADGSVPPPPAWLCSMMMPCRAVPSLSLV